jgi:hypothetical protein
VKTGPCTTHGRLSSRCTTFRHGCVTKGCTLCCLFLSKVRRKLASILMCNWNHLWKIWRNARMKGCVCGTSINMSISRCMQSYSFASMMLPGDLQYQDRLKGRVAHALFAWMELHQCTFHHPENWCTCDTGSSC